MRFLRPREPQVRVSMSEFIELSATQQDARDRHPCIQFLSRVGEGAAFGEFHQFVSGCTRMEAEVPVAGQGPQHGRRHGPHPYLQHGTIGNDLCDARSNPLLGSAIAGWWHFHGRMLALHDMRDLKLRPDLAPVASGEPWVDLRDHMPCPTRSVDHEIAGQPQVVAAAIE